MAHDQSDERGAGGACDGQGEEQGASDADRARGSEERVSSVELGRGGRRPSGVSKRCPDENKRQKRSKLWYTSCHASVRSLASDVLFVALSIQHWHDIAISAIHSEENCTLQSLSSRS
jgi:hypothetical protein